MRPFSCLLHPARQLCRASGSSALEFKAASARHFHSTRQCIEKVGRLAKRELYLILFAKADNATQFFVPFTCASFLEQILGHAPELSVLDHMPHSKPQLAYKTVKALTAASDRAKTPLGRLAAKLNRDD